MKYIKRTLESILKRALQEFPVVAITGPRQCGKTTLLQQLWSQKYKYISFDGLDVQLTARQDPRGFLKLYPPPVIFDEIQHVPELFPYIKEHVDRNQQQVGQFILTGSQNLLLTAGVSESLAGRVAMLRLLPLTFREMVGDSGALLPWQQDKLTSIRDESYAHLKLWNAFLRGGYPKLVAEKNREVNLWYSSYLQTYLERDVRSLVQVGDLRSFQIFLKALAARSGQLLNVSSIARSVGVTVNTIKAWISILEATYQIILLSPYSGNMGKRLVKAPKLYFADTGILCSLVGLKDPRHAMASPMKGTIMETSVVVEITRSLAHQGEEARIHFWRTTGGQEVDLVIETGMELIPIEVKSSTTPNPKMADGIRAFRKQYPQQVKRGYVVHPGTVTLPLGDNITALPFGSL